jgi:hypothetical protein
MEPSAPFWFSEPFLTLALAFLFLSLALLAPRASECFFQPVEGFLSRLAAHRAVVILILFLVVIAVRLALLNRLPVPNPGIHDEFSYLLMGDTFVHGRLANPTHPLWRSFESFHILWFPTYASKYPPAQGLILALGQLLGHPWIGVLLSAAAMAASFVWMLQTWIPSRWAFLAGVLAAARLCTASYWINSYWGGAAAAIGGALVLGAFGRMRRNPTLLCGALLGLGAAILLNSRPFEGFFLCAPVTVALVLWFFSWARDAKQLSLRKLALVSAGCVVLVNGCGMAYYNWRVVHNPLELPMAYAIHTNTHAAVFLWQKQQNLVHYDIPELEDFYNQEQINRYDRSWPALKAAYSEKLLHCASVFVWPACVLLIPGAFFLLRDKRLRLVFLVLLATLLAYCVVVWPGPHYLAPATAAWFGVLVQCIRHLRTFRLWGRPLGAALSRVVFLALLLDVAQLAWLRIPDPVGWGGWGLIDRAQLKDNLEATPGKHVVLVRYGPDHSVHEEWVYNGADIDASKIIWARDLPGERNDRLLAYYPDRIIWLVDPETNDVSILRYPVGSGLPLAKSPQTPRP